MEINGIFTIIHVQKRRLLTEDILVAAYYRLLLAIAVLTTDRVRDGGTAIAGVRGGSRFGGGIHGDILTILHQRHLLGNEVVDAGAVVHRV